MYLIKKYEVCRKSNDFFFWIWRHCEIKSVSNWEPHFGYIFGVSDSSLIWTNVVLQSFVQVRVLVTRYKNGKEKYRIILCSQVLRKVVRWWKMYLVWASCFNKMEDDLWICERSYIFKSVFDSENNNWGILFELLRCERMDNVLARVMCPRNVSLKGDVLF